MEKTIKSAFGIDTPKEILLSAVCPLGTGTNVEINPHFVFQKDSLKRVLNNLRIRKPIWVSGPSGAGKTELMRQIAARLDRNCHVISFGEESSLREMLGTFDLKPGEHGAHTEYRYGELVQAIQDPFAIVVLDEFNMAPPGVTAQFNRLLEAREITIPETGEKIRMGEGTCLVATSNTTGGMDRTGLYAGSQAQNGATRNRFAGLKVNYLSQEQEIQLLQTTIRTANGETLDQLINLGKPTTLIMTQIANSVRALVGEGKVSLPFSVRTLQQWGISTLMNGSLTLGFQDAYLDLIEEDEAVAVAEVFRKSAGIDPATGTPIGDKGE